MEPEKEPSSPSQSSLWPLVLLGTLVSALALFTSKRNHSSEPVSPQNTTSEKQRYGQIEPVIVSNVPPTPPQHNQTNGRKNNTPAWEKWAAIFIAAGTVGLLVVNILLWCTTTRQLDQLKRQIDDSESAQRAQLIIESDDRTACTLRMAKPPESDIGNFKIQCTFKVKNVGETVAKDIFVAPKLETADITKPFQPNISREPTPDSNGRHLGRDDFFPMIMKLVGSLLATLLRLRRVIPSIFS